MREKSNIRYKKNNEERIISISSSLFYQIDDGIYVGNIIDCNVLEEGKDGNLRLLITIELENGEQIKKILFTSNDSESPWAGLIRARFDEPVEEAVPSDLVGTTIMFKLKTKGSYQNIVQILPAEEEDEPKSKKKKKHRRERVEVIEEDDDWD